MKKKILIIAVIILIVGSICIDVYLHLSCKKIKTTEYWDMSSEAKSIQEQLKTSGGKATLQAGTFDQLIAQLKQKASQPIPQVKTENTLETVKYGDYDVYTISDEKYQNIVLYLHGGAYFSEIQSAHMEYCDKLAEELDAKVYMPIYPLAPQNDYKATYTLLENVYKDLINENKPIYIMGDSAGGGLTLAFTEYLKEKQMKKPTKIVMFSPWVDVTMTNPEIPNYEEKDLTLSQYGATQAGKLWAGDTDPKDYKISPIYGDLSNLPDMLVFVATDEILYPDIMKLYDKVENTNVRYIIGNGYWHVFPLSNIPEKEESIQTIKAFINW